ncbi:Hypothetical protein AA314_01204 [Archangium gephyra]|uniref:Uncharacterized protein n=1 Tax=Archangium gephyra TaxID=48 RepID=A0AAC8TBE9_9BACT|nr:Hypothetical protein AA314_01204 [Archangium gephyra]
MAPCARPYSGSEVTPSIRIFPVFLFFFSKTPGCEVSGHRPHGPRPGLCGEHGD